MSKKYILHVVFHLILQPCQCGIGRGHTGPGQDQSEPAESKPQCKAWRGRSLVSSVVSSEAACWTDADELELSHWILSECVTSASPCPSTGSYRIHCRLWETLEDSDPLLMGWVASRNGHFNFFESINWSINYFMPFCITFFFQKKQRN